MKIRAYIGMDNAVYRVSLQTEDWSEGEVELMSQFGEPDVNVGGDIEYIFEEEAKTLHLGDQFVRMMNGFPFSRGFDARDYGSYDEAVAAGRAWKDVVIGRITGAVVELRTKSAPLPTEEIVEV